MTNMELQRLCVALALVAACACSGAGQGEGAERPVAEPQVYASPDPAQRRVAVAELRPTTGHAVGGTVTFHALADGVRIEADLAGLTEGTHGFHIHELGDCSAADASSAGEHYALGGSPHGGPEDPADGRHVGDLGNVHADAQGRAVYSRVDRLLSLDGAETIVGKAVIVHAEADDLETQPSGGAGARIACGVIELREPGAGS